MSLFMMQIVYSYGVMALRLYFLGIMIGYCSFKPLNLKMPRKGLHLSRFGRMNINRPGLAKLLGVFHPETEFDRRAREYSYNACNGKTRTDLRFYYVIEGKDR